MIPPSAAGDMDSGSTPGADAAAARVWNAGPIRVDIGARRASLAEWPSRTQSRKQLLEKAWSETSAVADRSQTRTVDIHIRRLRGKLGENGGWIQTIRGFGYRLKIPPGVE